MRTAAGRGEAVEDGGDADGPAALDGGLRAAQPAGRFLRGQALHHREEDVGGVGRVAGDEAGVDAPADLGDDEPAHVVAGRELVGARIEVGERPRET